MGNWKHVHSPVGGLITDTPPTQLAGTASPNLSGVVLKSGVVSSDTGTVAFPPVSATTTNALNGVFMHAKQYTLFNGASYLVAFTTTCAYVYNTSTTTWDVISQGLEIDDCEAAWDASANVTSVADGTITGVIASISDYSGTVAGTVLVTDVAHGLSTGHIVIISGTTTYDGTYTVTVVDVDTFYITHAYGATSTGVWTTSYYKLRGTYSAKHIIAAAFTTGIVSSEDDVQTADISAASNTYLSLWIRSTGTHAADVFRLRLSEQATGGTGATYADYTIPAITADTWTHVLVAIASPVADDGGTYPDDLNALASVALVAQSDPGAVTIHLDDIRTIDAFTGDEDNRFSTTVMNDTLISTNGVDQPQKWIGTGVMADLVTTLASGSITTSEIIITAKDHLVFFNNIENGANAPQRGSWTNIGTLEDHVNGTAGYQDISDESWVIAVEQLSQDTWIIYKERSITKMTWVAGHTPFRFETMIPDRGAVAKDGVFDIGGKHVILDNGHLYGYIGDQEVTEIDKAIHDDFFSSIDTEYDNRSFMTYVKKENELQIWIPTSTAYPDTIWCLDIANARWYRKDRTMTGHGKYREQVNVTIGDLVGTIGEQNYRIGDNLSKVGSPQDIVGNVDGNVYKLWEGVLNDDGIAITNTFETPDFTWQSLDSSSVKVGSDGSLGSSSDEAQNRFFRVPQFVYEAKGQLLTTEYSTDGGTTWIATQGSGLNAQTLTNIWTYYEQDFDVTTRKIRFRFSNATVSSGFNLRYYGIYWIERSGRR